jgi:predicted tellurium resistance membrane protein TerC
MPPKEEAHVFDLILPLAADLATTTETGHGAGAGLTSLFSIEAIIALLTLTALEIVLGIDNIVFIAILAGRLPEHQRKKARSVGLSLAMGIRILLLLSIAWIMGLVNPLVYIPIFWTAEGGQFGISGRDLILIIGGLFLIGKSTFEIHDKLEGVEHAHGAGKVVASFGAVILQILLLDIVFSLDSVITAVGMVRTDPAHKWIGLTVMITAVVIAVAVMLIAAGPVASFVERHPTMKMLALSFLLLIGVMLVVEGLHGHIPKGYIYFAMAFSLAVEFMNMRLRRVSQPVHLHHTGMPAEAKPSASAAA